MYCPDNYDAFREHDARQEQAFEKLPECSECGYKITTDECYEFNDELICPECLKDNHRKWTENYIE